MSEIPRQLTPEELHQWQTAIEEADLHNILCHCREAAVSGLLLLQRLVLVGVGT